MSDIYFECPGCGTSDTTGPAGGRLTDCPDDCAEAKKVYPDRFVRFLATGEETTVNRLAWGDKGPPKGRHRRWIPGTVDHEWVDNTDAARR